MTTLIAYLILQATIITGGSTANKEKSASSTTAKCVTRGGGWDDITYKSK